MKKKKKGKQFTELIAGSVVPVSYRRYTTLLGKEAYFKVFAKIIQKRV